MRKIGNLFKLAEKQLIKEKVGGIIPCYTILDIIEYAYDIRKWLDKNPTKINEVMRLSREEIQRKKKIYRRERYLKTGK